MDLDTKGVAFEDFYFFIFSLCSLYCMTRYTTDASTPSAALYHSQDAKQKVHP